ncbi:M23 family metallopeptidase [Erythrobacter mangrovi]|uniref:M23 family metallopeptidase n=2 Tax=Erythrobacter mangrovi TaxID=2739433 RepID=A0A7D4CCI1_9SPHN|nr:M23 family metallopeptidase [Erythrobacter mangrovi]
MDGFAMASKRNSLVIAIIAAGLSIAAAPAHAGDTNTAAAVGTIDVSRVAGTIEDGDDAQFQQLFANWEEVGRPAGIPAHALVAVPSRLPLDNTTLTSDFGMRTHPVLGGRRNHKGVDLSAPMGTPIYATADGYVSKAEWFSSYGNFVSLEHGAELQTRYAHMSRIAVAPGTRVQKGDIIGYVGSTGRSTGPHLHYEVRIGGEAVNPIPYMVESDAQRAYALAMGTGGQGDGDDN